MNIESLKKLIDTFKKIPGISKKQAEKISYNLVTKFKKLGNELSISINEAQKKIVMCSICGFLSEFSKCDICLDKEKNRHKILVIVESSLDVIKLEKSNSIKPFYHVLNGLVDINKKNKLDNININLLSKRSQKFQEIIIALSSNIEGIVTSNYIKSIIKNKKVTQLAQGIPLGATMEYVDELTLKTAINNRKDII